MADQLCLPSLTLLVVPCGAKWTIQYSASNCEDLLERWCTFQGESGGYARFYASRLDAERDIEEFWRLEKERRT